MNHGHVSVFILFKARTGHEIRIHQAHLVSGEQAEIFLRRLFHEVLTLDIQLSSKRNLTASQRLIFQVVGRFQQLYLSFRIVVDHQLDGIQHRHHSGPLQLEVLTDAVFQHRIIHRGIALGNAAQIHEHLDGFRREAAPSQGCNGHQPGIVPAVHDAVLHQPLDVAFTGHHVGEVHLGKLDLSGRNRIFQLPHHPVIQRSVILKLQRTDGMGNSLNSILNGMGKVIHGIDAPLVPGVVMAHVSHAVDHRIAHVHVGGCHIDPGAQHLFPVRVYAVFHIFKQGQILLHAASCGRVLLSRLRERPAVLPDLIRRQVRYIGLSLFNQLYGRLIHLVKIVGSEEQPVLPVRSQPLHILLDGVHEFLLFLGGIRVVKTEIEFAAVFSGKSRV